MKNIKKLITMMLIFASVFFLACSDDEEEKLTKDEAVTEITQLSTDLSVKLDQMMESDGMIAMEALMNLPFPFDSVKSANKSAVLTNVEKYLLPYNYLKKDKQKTITEGEPFDFETYKGVYTYHNTPFPYWEIEPGGDIIEINFPSDTSNMDVNDVTFTLYNYEDVELDGELLPTIIDADLYISEIKVVDINLTAGWFTSGEYLGEPTSLNVSVYLIPFEFSGSFSHTSTAGSINFAILYNDVQFFSTGVGATWANVGDSIPSNINGHLQIFEVNFQADINLTNLMAMIPAEGQTSQFTTFEELLIAINDEIDADVKVSGTWAADIELAFTVPNEAGENPGLDILFVYADGSSESAIPYFEDLGGELEKFFGNLEEYYSTW